MKKTTIIFIIILIIGGLIYFYTNGSPVDNNSSLQTVDNSSVLLSDSIGARALSLLNQVNSLKIDSTVFNSAVYQSLVDYSVEIPVQNVGRVNPFAPYQAPAPIVIPNKSNSTKSR